MTNATPKRVLLGWEFAALSEQQCIDYILHEILAGRGGWVVTANLDHLRRLVREEEFAVLCREADLLVADGMPLIWASRIQGTPLPERIAGSSLISTLSAGAVKQECSVFFLGGDPGTAEAAADVLRRLYPGLKVAGACCPILGRNLQQDEQEIAQIANSLTIAQPDIVYVALGSPKQEVLISRLRNLLPGAWWLGVGISFSYVCGRIKRAPAWARRLGLEWFYRLVQEPHRLSRRYLRNDLPFFFVLFLRTTAIGFGRRWFSTSSK